MLALAVSFVDDCSLAGRRLRLLPAGDERRHLDRARARLLADAAPDRRAQHAARPPPARRRDRDGPGARGPDRGAAERPRRARRHDRPHAGRARVGVLGRQRPHRRHARDARAPRAGGRAADRAADRAGHVVVHDRRARRPTRPTAPSTTRSRSSRRSTSPARAAPSPPPTTCSTSPDPPDAIYATLDRLALGVLLAAEGKGVRVPEDLRIAGCTDSEASRAARPALTALSLNPERIGREAIELLIELIEHGVARGAAPDRAVAGDPARLDAYDRAVHAPIEGIRMVKLTVLYGPPTDAAAFEDYYVEHAPPAGGEAAERRPLRGVEGHRHAGRRRAALLPHRRDRLRERRDAAGLAGLRGGAGGDRGHRELRDRRRHRRHLGSRLSAGSSRPPRAARRGPASRTPRGCAWRRRRDRGRPRPWRSCGSGPPARRGGPRRRPRRPRARA